MLNLTRDSGYADRLRYYEVFLDGNKIGNIADGETKKFDVDTGEHTLRMKIDWGKSLARRYLCLRIIHLPYANPSPFPKF